MSKGKILLVEDDAIISIRLQDLLESWGYQVQRTDSGEDALIQALDWQPDLALVDILLAGEWDGFQFVEQLHLRQKTPVIYLSALSDSEMADRAMQSEAYGFLVKPVHELDLHHAIDLALYKFRLDSKLKESEARYQGLFERLPIGLYRTAPDGSVLDVNPAMVKLLGYPDRETLMKMPVDQGYVYPKDREIWKDSLIRNGMVRNYDVCWRGYHGEPVWVSENASLIRDKLGNILFYEGAVIDITRRKQAEEALIDSEERYRRVSELVSDFAFSIKIEADGSYSREWTTEGFDRITGFVKAERDQRGGVLGLVHPDDRKMVDELLARLLKSPEAVAFEVRILNSRGEVRWLGITLKTVWDVSAGRVIRFLGAGSDRSEQKQIEERMRNRAMQQATIAELSQRALLKQDLQELLDEAVHQAAQRLHVEMCAILEVLQDQNSMRIRSGVGWSAGLVGVIIQDLDAHSLADLTLQSIEPVVAPNFSQETRFKLNKWLLDQGARSGVSTIIGQPDKPFGILAVFTRQPRSYTLDEVHFLQAVANILAVAIERSRVEQALSESEERFRMLVNQAGDAFLLTDQDGRFVAVNRQACENLGYTEAEFNLLSVTDIDRELQGIEYFCDEMNQLTPGQPNLQERSYRRKDGAQIPVELRSSLIEIDGRKMVLTLARDISARKQAEEQLRRRDRILEVISEVALHFLWPGDWDCEVNFLLQNLGNATGASRTYIFVNSVNEGVGLVATLSFEWVAPGISSQIDSPDLQQTPYLEAGMQRWQDQLSRGEVICGRVREFPQSELALLSSQGILSLLVVPIFSGTSWYGFMGFDDCQQERDWSPAEIDALTAVAGIFGAALERRRSENTLRQRKEELERFERVTISRELKMVALKEQLRILEAKLKDRELD